LRVNCQQRFCPLFIGCTAGHGDGYFVRGKWWIVGYVHPVTQQQLQAVVTGLQLYRCFGLPAAEVAVVIVGGNRQ
jgi:hypothetical protein